MLFSHNFFFAERNTRMSPEYQNTTNIVDDAIRLVFGKEARGRVHGMGFGVTPSKVGAFVKQNGTVQQLQTMVQSLQQQMQQNQLEMQEMRSMFLQSMNKQNQQEHVASGGIDSGIGNEVGNNGDIDIGAKKNGDFDHVSQVELHPQIQTQKCITLFLVDLVGKFGFIRFWWRRWT
ncbi:uncharacterized protein [Primulina eburnea]|uniref:uncharacterized protein isoform X2 n=1 Tax=Primulina eburnea TaxID=1245227 RepID=UPI003C6C3D12